MLLYYSDQGSSSLLTTHYVEDHNLHQTYTDVATLQVVAYIITITDTSYFEEKTLIYPDHELRLTILSFNHPTLRD